MLLGAVGGRSRSRNSPGVSCVYMSYGWAWFSTLASGSSRKRVGCLQAPSY